MQSFSQCAVLGSSAAWLEAIKLPVFPTPFQGDRVPIVAAFQQCVGPVPAPAATAVVLGTAAAALILFLRPHGSRKALGNAPCKSVRQTVEDDGEGDALFGGASYNVEGAVK